MQRLRVLEINSELNSLTIRITNLSRSSMIHFFKRLNICKTSPQILKKLIARNLTMVRSISNKKLCTEY